MLDLNTHREPESPSIDVIGWCLRIGIAGFFLLAGYEKFPSEGMWVRMFDEIGFGQWFRYFTGVVEVLGGLLFAVPRTTRFGAVLVGSAMAGAIAVHIFVLGHPGSAVIPAAALAAVLIVGFRSR